MHNFTGFFLGVSVLTVLKLGFIFKYSLAGERYGMAR